MGGNLAGTVRRNSSFTLSVGANDLFALDLAFLRQQEFGTASYRALESRRQAVCLPAGYQTRFAQQTHESDRIQVPRTPGATY